MDDSCCFSHVCFLCLIDFFFCTSFFHLMSSGQLMLTSYLSKRASTSEVSAFRLFYCSLKLILRLFLSTYMVGSCVFSFSVPVFLSSNFIFIWQVMSSTRIWWKVWIMRCLTKWEVRLARSLMLERMLMQSQGNWALLCPLGFVREF